MLMGLVAEGSQALHVHLHSSRCLVKENAHVYSKNSFHWLVCSSFSVQGRCQRGVEYLRLTFPGFPQVFSLYSSSFGNTQRGEPPVVKTTSSHRAHRTRWSACRRTCLVKLRVRPCVSMVNFTGCQKILETQTLDRYTPSRLVTSTTSSLQFPRTTDTRLR